ncbi:DUF4907 domain-containing protein [Leeuwenhoekiella sp. A16]|uniref:DUF4907 domain-containing protein n=1 Tax=unclassified Leeuwenhoekiella TaxID=2615029 RepID=UPI003A7F8C48
MKLKTLFIYAGLLIIGCGIIWRSGAKNDLKVQIFRSEMGYGYKIIDHEKTLIKQTYIPALEKKAVFCTKEDAKKIAHLVIEKITLKLNPAISKEELENTAIALDCYSQTK